MNSHADDHKHAASTREREIQAVFKLVTSAQEGHPNPEYTHRCDVTLLGQSLFERWGRNAGEAELNAEWQVGVNLRRLLARG